MVMISGLRVRGTNRAMAINARFKSSVIIGYALSWVTITMWSSSDIISRIISTGLSLYAFYLVYCYLFGLNMYAGWLIYKARHDKFMRGFVFVVATASLLLLYAAIIFGHQLSLKKY
jgi:hypothetical protein